MAICSGCGSEAAPHLCSRCQKARYCSRPCQTGHWRQHKSECRAPAPSSEADAAISLGTRNFSCPECAQLWADCVCEDPPACWICFESSAELLRGCACRGTTGYVHVTCMVKANRRRTIDQDQCPTCEQRFVGALSMALAEARVRQARASSSDIDCIATSELAQACHEQGRYNEALGHYRNVLRQSLLIFGPEHPTVATTKVHLCMHVHCVHT